MPMRILLGAHGFPPNQAGGAEWRAHRTAGWLSSHGHSVQVLAVDDTRSLPAGKVRISAEQVGGATVRRLSYGLDQSRGKEAEYDNSISARVLGDLFAAERFDIFHLISGFRLSGSVLQAARKAAVAAVVTLTDFWFLCPRLALVRADGALCEVPEDPLDCALCLLEQRRRYRMPAILTRGATRPLLKSVWRAAGFRGAGDIRRLYETMAARRRVLLDTLRSADKVVAPSHFLARLFEQRGFPQSKLAVIRQGVSLPDGRPATEYAPGRPLTFGYVGRLAKHKGLTVLARAFRRLPYGSDAVRLRIYGDPDQSWPGYMEELRRAIAGDERIELAGAFPHPDAARIYAGLDALIVPSTWYENSPNVILEAFACGVPVIASDLGGMAELVGHEVSGCLFPAGNVEALAGRLERIAREPGVLAGWRRGIPRVKTLDEEMRELEDLYGEIGAARRVRSLQSDR